MTTPGDYKSQLEELTVQICIMVSEKLYMSIKDQDMNPVEKSRIINMIEDQLPTVVTNAIAKTPSLHTASGIDELQKNLDSWAETFARQFLGRI